MVGGTWLVVPRPWSLRLTSRYEARSVIPSNCSEWQFRAQCYRGCNTHELPDWDGLLKFRSYRFYLSDKNIDNRSGVLQKQKGPERRKRNDPQ